MIWFWLHTVLVEPRFQRYRYILRMDTDSLLLSPYHGDPAAHLRATGGVLGYHCFGFEYPKLHYARTLGHFLAATWHNATAARRHSLAVNAAGVNATETGAAVNGTVGGNETSPAASLVGVGMTGFHLSPDPTVIPLFYNNFMVLDRKYLASRSDVRSFLLSALPGVVAHGWGDAPLYAAIAGLYLNDTQFVHIRGLHYMHGRGNRFITLPGNQESVEWNASIWATRGIKPVIGHCWDRRIPIECILSEAGGPAAESEGLGAGKWTRLRRCQQFYGVLAVGGQNVTV